MSTPLPECTLAPLHLASRTHVLGNGMRIVAHEDHGAPIVCVHLMYHVGSADESPGRTGLAHLLEHLMFEGTEHCPKGEFDRLLEGVGGSNNGSTWLDRTNYYETVPSHAVELALWLERERMAHFLPVLDAAMLELQREVVINERRQAYENRPYGMADERLHHLLFPEGHPYGWPTIGYTPDLRAITLRDARDFYRRFYTPRNAVLVLAGDLDPDRAFGWAERFFGDLPAGPAVPEAPPPIPGPAGGAEGMTDAVSFPRLYRAWAVPPYGTPDWIALDVLAYLLADGESSRLHRALVREARIAQDVDSYLYPTARHGIWGVVATASSGIPAEALGTAIDRELARVADEGVDAEEVLGAIRRVRRDQLAEFATVEERAEALAYAATVLGDADALNGVLDGYAAVTPDDVRRVARDHLMRGPSATLRVLPEAEATEDAA